VKHRGFSIPELVVALLILAVLTSAVMLRVHSPLENARAEELVGRLGDFDRTTRTFARRGDRPLRLVVDVSGGRLSRMNTGTDEPAEIGQALRLPSGCRIDAAYLGAERIGRGEMAIVVTRCGLTPTYALKLTWRDGRDVWLLVAGLSGQMMSFEDYDSFEKTYETLTQNGRDAG
jgi:prepilin-type N-terminal cleavage/methylation domain-containing protein